MNLSSRSLKIWTSFSFVLSQSTRLTDRRTDRILIARPRLHSMQRGKKRGVPLTRRVTHHSLHGADCEIWHPETRTPKAKTKGSAESVDHSIGVARILSGGALFSSNKLTTFFQSSPSKDRLNLLNKPPNIPRPAKMS